LNGFDNFQSKVTPHLSQSFGRYGSKVLMFRCKKCTGAALEKARKKIRNKVLKVMLFLTVWQTLTFTLSTLATLALNPRPFRGSLQGPYFRALYYLKGLASLLCYAFFIDKFRVIVKKSIWLIFKQVKVGPMSPNNNVPLVVVPNLQWKSKCIWFR